VRKKLIIAVIFAIFLSTRLIGLGNDISNSDSGRWHRRSEKFLEALKQKDLKSTYQRYHPGVTLMWINSIVKQVAFKYQLTYTQNPKTLENADYFPLIHGVSKGVNVLVLAVLLGIQMFFVSKLFGREESLVYGFMISLEPYVVGINRWFHLSSFEVFFGFTSLLCLLYWRKNQGGKFLVFASLLYSLSVLSKMSSLILLPVFICVFMSTKKWKDFCYFTLLTCMFVFLLFPALYVDPFYVFNKIFNALQGAISTDIRGSMISIYLRPFYYLVILGFKLSPITLILSILALFSLVKNPKFTTKIVLMSLIINYVFLSASDQRIDRYSLVFILPLLLLVSVFLVKHAQKWLMGVITVYFLLVAYAYHPVYSAYYSPLFGGTKGAINSGLYDNSGEYFAQAAAYLNNKGRDVNTYVPNGYESFSYFYKGNAQREFSNETKYVIRSYDMSRSSVVETVCSDLEKSFGPANFPIVYIYKCD